MPSTLIRCEGRHALDLLHRISTQHVRDLATGECRPTLFCDFRGRVQHRVAVARTADGQVWLARPDAAAAELVKVIERQIFRDDVRLEDASDRAAVTTVAATERPAGTVVERDGLPAALPWARGVDLVITDGAAAPALDEAQRIRLGAPRHGHELRDDFNPFEVALARDVHLDKGCFTGQEALLRMMTYRGVRRQLALLVGEGELPARGGPVNHGSVPAGIVTSATHDGGGWVALAVLKRDVLASGAMLSAGSATAIARVTPFPDTRPLGLPDTPAPS